MGTHHQLLAPALLLPTLRSLSPAQARMPGLGVLRCSHRIVSLGVRRELVFKMGINASSTFPLHGHWASA